MWRPIHFLAIPSLALVLGAAQSHGAHGASSLTGASPTFSRVPGAAVQRPDSADLHDRARRAQDRFESLRRRAMPRTGRSNPWRECDEVVGRFCLFFGGESDWEPVPDSPEVLQARGDLLDSLTVVASEIPGDEWVVGQLVQYLGEEGRWGEALEWVEDCSAWEGARDVVSAFARARPGWWCHALRGFVLHRSDRYGAALEAFERALERMHPDRRERWLDPDLLLDREADDVWDDAEAGERPAVRRRLWALSDPLYMLNGNDRLTEHYARHTISWIREDAENPYGMSWGWDLEELVVRYGPEMGWNRTTTSAGSLRPPNVVGHHHPESRHFLPPGRALADPAALEEAGWGADPDEEGSSGAPRPTTAYAPPYAPDLRFEPYQIARFRREREMIVVAGYRLPPDTLAAGEPREAPDGVDGRDPGDPGLQGGGPNGLPPDSRLPGTPPDVRARLFLFDPSRGLDPAEDAGTSGAGEAGESSGRTGGVGSGGDDGSGGGGGDGGDGGDGGGEAGGDPRASGPFRRGPERGVLRARVPMGRYLASVEVWDSATARAGRSRRGVGLDPLPSDVAAISDLLILDPPLLRPSSFERGAPSPSRAPSDSAPSSPTPSDSAAGTPPSPPTSGLPQDLDAAIPLVRPLAEMCPGEGVAVGWELTGVGFRRDPVAFALRLEKTDRGFLSRVGDFLGLSSPPEPLTLEWTEAGPDEPRPFFRSVALALPPELEPGAYRVTVQARLPGREAMERARGVVVREPGACGVS